MFFIHLSKVNFSIVNVYDNTSVTFVFTQKDFRFLARSHYLFVNGGRGQTDLEAGLLSWALSQSAPLALPTLQSIPALPITLFLPQNKLQTVNADGIFFFRTNPFGNLVYFLFHIKSKMMLWFQKHTFSWWPCGWWILSMTTPEEIGGPWHSWCGHICFLYHCSSFQQ